MSGVQPLLLAVAALVPHQPSLVTLRGSPSTTLPTLHAPQFARAPPVVATTTADDDAGGTVQDGAALIAGTAIGGGILALPSCTAPLGVGPTLVGLFGVWLFFAITGVAWAEAASTTLEECAAEEGCDPTAVSVVSVTRGTLGELPSALCSLAFLSQMVAITTAQLVKAGELASEVMPFVPYEAGAIASAVAVGAFAFVARPALVDRTNTLLTAALVAGFCLLVFSTAKTTLAAGAALPALGARLSFADWSMLSPTGTAVPVFLQVLCYGQSVPLVVNRIGGGRPRALRAAILLGSFIPFALSATWAVLTSVLLDPGMPGVMSATSGAFGEGVTNDPLVLLLRGPLEVALPVGTLAVGAIGTTLIAAFIALGEFAEDAICAVAGKCSVREARLAQASAVAVPAALALGGTSIYLPLLAFSGSFPSMLLYGLVPPLALAVLRDRASDAPRLLPDGQTGNALLGAIALGAVVFLAISASGVASPL